MVHRGWTPDLVMGGAPLVKGFLGVARSTLALETEEFTKRRGGTELKVRVSQGSVFSGGDGEDQAGGAEEAPCRLTRRACGHRL